VQNFVETFLNFTKDFESPTSFFKWAAFATIGAILRDNVYIMQGTSKLCPNLFIITLAKSGGRKARPPQICLDLLRRSKATKIIAGRSSIEAILDTLSTDETHKDTGKMTPGGSCILIAPELLSFFVGSESLVPVLTDMYDFKEDWDSKLRGLGGNFKIKNMCVSMLAASNEPNMRVIYQGMALHGGLLGRTFLVAPDEDRPPNSLMGNETEEYDYNIFTNQINALKQMKGKVRIDAEARTYYDNWYRTWYYYVLKKGDTTGVLGRVHTNALKIGMILGAAELYEPIIQKHHFEEAIELCTSLLKNYELFVMATGKSNIQEAGTLVLHDLWSAKDHKLSRKDVLSNHWGQFDAETLDKLITTFEGGGLILQFVNGNGIDYMMTDKCIKIFERQKGSVQ
jgi:hypothetical protein